MMPSIFHAPVNRRAFVFVLPVVFLLTVAGQCNSRLELPSYDEPLPVPSELENARAYATISPLKDVYKVGDTIVCTLRATQKDWNSWPDFDYADYGFFKLFNNDSSKFLPEKSTDPRRATRLPSGDSFIEQILYYELDRPAVYVFGDFPDRPTPYPPHLLNYQSMRNLTVELEDPDRNFRKFTAYIPVHFAHTDSQNMTIRVEE